jgi:hypothetical protein
MIGFGFHYYSEPGELHSFTGVETFSLSRGITLATDYFRSCPKGAKLRQTNTQTLEVIRYR